MSQPRNKKFQDLQAEWYKKLKESGFDDIEETRNGKTQLKTWDSVYFTLRHSPVQFQAKQTYFERAGRFLESNLQTLEFILFDKQIYREIWELHCKGLSFRTIAAELEISKYKVERIVGELIASMKQKGNK